MFKNVFLMSIAAMLSGLLLTSTASAAPNLAKTLGTTNIQLDNLHLVGGRGYCGHGFRRGRFHHKRGYRRGRFHHRHGFRRHYHGYRGHYRKRDFHHGFHNDPTTRFFNRLRRNGN